MNWIHRFINPSHAGQIMGSYATTFALVGGTFAVVDCLAETVRGAPHTPPQVLISNAPERHLPCLVVF